jgi:hypothetical protein
MFVLSNMKHNGFIYCHIGYGIWLFLDTELTSHVFIMFLLSGQTDKEGNDFNTRKDKTRIG